MYWIHIALIFTTCVVTIKPEDSLSKGINVPVVETSRVIEILKKYRPDLFLNNGTESSVQSTTNVESLRTNDNENELVQKSKTNVTYASTIDLGERTTQKSEGEQFNMLHEGDFKDKIKVLPQEKDDVTETLNTTNLLEKNDDYEWTDEESKEDEMKILIQNDMRLINLNKPKKGLPFNFVVTIILAILVLMVIVFFFVHRWKKTHVLRINHKILVEEDDIKHFSI